MRNTDSVNYSLSVLKDATEKLEKSADNIGRYNKDYEDEVNRLNESWTTPSGKKNVCQVNKF